MANAAPRQMVQAMDIGDGYGLLGLQLRPLIDKDGNLCAVLTAVGGKRSDLVPTVPYEVVFVQLGKIPLTELKRELAKAAGEKLDPEPAPSGLVVVP